MNNKISQKTIPFKQLHEEWMQDPEYAREYEKLEPEFQIAKAIIDARIRKKITQEQLAKKAGTGQAVISRLENMNGKPSLALIQRVADALGLRTQIQFLPK